MFAKIIVIIVVAAMLQHAIRTIYHLGLFKVIFFHAPGTCKQIEGINYGAEDLTILPNGLVYISSGLVKNDGKGRILTYNMNITDTPVQEMTLDGVDPESFRPHGISVWIENGIVHLFVINHDQVTGVEKVEHFQHDGKKSNLALKHIKTVTDSNFQNLNDIVATGPNTFYATNYSPTTSGWINFIYLLVNWRSGSVVYYDGTQSMQVESGLLMANGINTSPDNKFLYVVEFGIGRLKIYEILKDNKLKAFNSIVLGTGIDNIDVNPDDGSLWLGCHPCGFESFVEHNLFPGTFPYTGSQVLKIAMKDGVPGDVTEVYSDEGQRISGSSVASFYKGKLLIGTVQNGAIICDGRTIPYW